MNHCEKCIFMNIDQKCEKKTEYGNYCKTHKRNYLLNDKNDIVTSRFTFSEKDYLKPDLSKYCKNTLCKKVGKLSKKELFVLISNHIKDQTYYENNISNIIRIQSLFRKNTSVKIEHLRCNNREDFYSYELLIDIPKKYFYFYIDNSNIQWGFDIRSLKKLIDLEYPNPYTTEVIPDDIKNYVLEKYNKLKLEDNYEDNIEIIQRDRTDMIKQKVVDLFSLIEQHGYSCNIEWLLNLSLRRLKELYRQLEDLWNYRLGLSIEYKRIISPPTGALFTTPVIEVQNYTNKQDIQELIINEVSKMNHCESDSDRRMGYFYFIIGLGQVSQNCWITHQDILVVI